MRHFLNHLLKYKRFRMLTWHSNMTQISKSYRSWYSILLKSEPFFLVNCGSEICKVWILLTKIFHLIPNSSNSLLNIIILVAELYKLYATFSYVFRSRQIYIVSNLNGNCFPDKLVFFLSIFCCRVLNGVIEILLKLFFHRKLKCYWIIFKA